MDIVNRLSGGTRRTLGSTREVSKAIIAGEGSVDDIFAALFIEDTVVRVRAIHVLADVVVAHPEWVQPFKTRLFDEVSGFPEWEVKQQWCAIMPQLDLDEDDFEQAIEILQRYLDDKSSFVKTAALQSLTDLLEKDPSLVTDIVALLDCYAVEGTPAMRARCRKLLKKLEKEMP